MCYFDKGIHGSDDGFYFDHDSRYSWDCLDLNISIPFRPGDIVQHFKREMVEGEKGTQYLYEVLGIANHTETKEKLAVYRALYGEKLTYARPFDMFMSEVDRDKYPNATQQYRFEEFKF